MKRPTQLAVAVLVFAAVATFSIARAGIWDDALDEESEYERHLAAGDHAARIAASHHDHGQGVDLERLVLEAVSSYEAAARARPKAAEPYFRAAEILYAHHVSARAAPDPGLTNRAIEYWKRYEELAPKDPRLEGALFRRSIAYTKLGGEDNFRLAIADYEAQLRLTDESTPDTASNTALILSNTAELYMAVGELDESLTLYKRALGLSNNPLYGYGLALALERHGQGEKAREVMRTYGATDKLHSITRDNGVFFVPEGEAFAYHALFHDAFGHTDRAIGHYESFLRALPASRWSDAARRRLAELRGQSNGNGGKTGRRR